MEKLTTTQWWDYKINSDTLFFGQFSNGEECIPSNIAPTVRAD